LRVELTKAPFRDCVDFIEFDLDSERWLRSLSSSVVSGAYRPQEPTRREAAKGNGVYRTITSPAIDDLLVYRHIADYVYEQARSKEISGAFFSRRYRKEPVGKKLESITDDEYDTFFEIWLRYSKYREQLLRSGLYEFLLLTDISNYFESILHELLLEYIAPHGLPREALGVLAQLLDVLRPSTGHSRTPAVGLSLDQFDCSRMLAHVFLFEHDSRIAAAVEPDAYVRWMDDQTVGVKSEVEARRLVRLMTQSLGLQRLTLNSGKTRALRPVDLAKHFWLAANDELDKLEKRIQDNVGTLGEHQASLNDRWIEFQSGGRVGNWDKVGARIFSLAARTQNDVIGEDYCRDFLTAAPSRASRVFEYLIARDRFEEHCRLFDWWLDSGNSLYEDVEGAWFDSLLTTTPKRSVRVILRERALEFVHGARRGTRRGGARSPAAMLLYWIGDGQEGRLLQATLRSNRGIDGPTRRTLAAILCAAKPDEYREWLSHAAREPSGDVSSLIQWITRLQAGEPFSIPTRFLSVRRPHLLQRYVYDARAWLRLELVSLSPRADIRRKATEALMRVLWNDISPAESVIATRLRTRLGITVPSGSTRHPTPRRLGLQQGHVPQSPA
jgi:hypothetical protein